MSKRYVVMVYPNQAAKDADTDDNDTCLDYAYAEVGRLLAAKAQARKAQAAGLILHETQVFDWPANDMPSCIGEYDAEWNYSE